MVILHFGCTPNSLGREAGGGMVVDTSVLLVRLYFQQAEQAVLVVGNGFQYVKHFTTHFTDAHSAPYPESGVRFPEEVVCMKVNFSSQCL